MRGMVEYLMNFLLTCCISISYAAETAEYEISDSSVLQELNEVTIRSGRSHKLPDIQSTQIYAGKKTEMLYLGIWMPI
jgi:hypothetical protein